MALEFARAEEDNAEEFKAGTIKPDRSALTIHGVGGMKMGAIKIMPCLDMKEGRVVKGIHFVDLKDAGDPVENAAFLRFSLPHPKNSGRQRISFKKGGAGYFVGHSGIETLAIERSAILFINCSK